MAFISKFKLAANFIKKAYNKNLLVSNTLTTMSLLGAGDLMTQFIEIKISKFNIPHSMLTSSGMQTNKMLTSKSCSIVTVNNGFCEDEEDDSFFKKYDWKRTAIGLMMGPFGHYWYTGLDKIFHASTGLNVLRKMICDQLIAAPIFNCMTIVGTYYLDGKTLNESFEILREKFLNVYMYDCLIWPVAQLINFNYIPAVYRLLYVNAVSLFWNSIMSFLMFDQNEEIKEEN